MAPAHHTQLNLSPQRPPTGAPHPLRRLAARAASLYIHIPFCFHKCHYCDFYSIVDRRDRQAAFADRLARELASIAPWAGPIRTIFVGGGTPTLLAPDLWRTLLDTLHQAFDLAAIRHGEGEFTVECNPETATPELMATLAAGGVNRISIGAQSFDHRHLKTLERWHDPTSVPRALGMARAAGIARASIDLIFAIPGQSFGDWRRDLDHALSLGLEHISCYGLTYEPGTAMTARLRRGEFTPAEETLEAEMYEHTVAALRAAGLQRYEVSNFAAPGRECRHNLAYWRQEEWLAAGPSASAHLAGHRWKNVPRLDDYLGASDDGLPPIVDHEPPDPARAEVERVMTGLRLAEGLDGRAVLARVRSFDPAAADSMARAIMRAAERGLLREAAGRWALSDAGFLVADRVVLDVVSPLIR